MGCSFTGQAQCAGNHGTTSATSLSTARAIRVTAPETFIAKMAILVGPKMTMTAQGVPGCHQALLGTTPPGGSIVVVASTGSVPAGTASVVLCGDLVSLVNHCLKFESPSPSALLMLCILAHFRP